MRILIITTFIEPVQSVASIRWTKLGKYLALEGHDVSILTDEKVFNRDRGAGPLFRVDSELEKDSIYFNDYYIIKNSIKLKMLYWVWNEKNYRRRKKSERGSVRARPQSNWKTACIKNNLIARAALKQYGYLANSFDVLISTFDPLWPHEVAREFKIRNPKIIWLADFRDPVYGTTHYCDPASVEWAAKITDNADLISYIDDSGPNVLGIDPNRNTFMAISNGYDDESVSPALDGAHKNKHFTVVYTGTLYDIKLQNPAHIISALNRLIEDGIASEGSIEFIYAGPDGDILSTALSGDSKVKIINLGLVDRKDALQLQRESDVLILLTWNNQHEQGIATGKLYEYLAANRPICAYVSGDTPGSVVKSILDSTRSGAAFEEGSGLTLAEEQMYKYFSELYAQWSKTGYTQLVNADSSAYTHKRIAHNLSLAIERLQKTSMNNTTDIERTKGNTERNDSCD